MIEIIFDGILIKLFYDYIMTILIDGKRFLKKIFYYSLLLLSNIHLECTNITHLRRTD